MPGLEIHPLSGLRATTVDRRSVDLPSSRFWSWRDFRPQHLRLYRAVA